MANETKNSNSQHPNSREAPSTKNGSASDWRLALGMGYFLEVGCWDLQFLRFPWGFGFGVASSES